MSDLSKEVQELKNENKLLKEELERLKQQINFPNSNEAIHDSTTQIPKKIIKTQLDKYDVSRYSRQLLLSEISREGQLKLINSSVLLVGAGGLCSTSGIYLAGAGVGRLGIVDYDTVEESNLHRQIIHNQSRLGLSKALSAKKTINDFNPRIEVFAYNILFNRHSALDIIKDYDVVVDCSDNVSTRYLINDACVLSKKPLVSGSALRMDGQMTVYNYEGGPCYRCLFPVPPSPETVGNCSDNGVLGVVPGTIGCLQALEAIKIIIGKGKESTLSGRLLLFNANSTDFKTIKLRDRNKNCDVCGDNPKILELIDYELFCGSGANDKVVLKNVLSEDYHITCGEYKTIQESGKEHILIDVRNAIQYNICSLNNSWNIPLGKIKESSEEIKKKFSKEGETLPVYVMCRRGIASQRAVKILRDEMGFNNVKNIWGGLTSWSNDVDPNFPIY